MRHVHAGSREAVDVRHQLRLCLRGSVQGGTVCLRRFFGYDLGMELSTFRWGVVALLVLGTALPALRHRYYAVPALVIFGIPSGILIWIGGLVAGWIPADPGRDAVLVALTTLHAALIASVLSHFLFRLPRTRLELLFVVPGQTFFVALLLFPPVYFLGRLVGAHEAAPLALAAAPFAMAAYAMTMTHTTRFVNVELRVDGLGAPLRIVHLSDMHVGTFMGDWRLERMADEINAQKPDLILATGDFVTVRSEQDYSPLVRFFERLERPRYGVYGCLGNHDLPVAKALLADLERAGVRMLVNTGETIDVGGAPLRIAGLSFFWRDRRKRYEDAFRKAAGGDAPVLLLCHDPAAFDFLPAGWRGVMFAGHLHGGQIGLTRFGIRWSVLKPLGMYDQGTFHRGEVSMYVHRGTGVYGFPVRMGVPAEVAVVSLVRS